MGALYRTAWRVVVWLGPGTPESDNVFAFFQRTPSPENAEAEERATAEARDNLYHHLSRRPWFRRVWVIQEIALARAAQVRCGRFEMAWDTLLDRWMELERADTVASAAPGGSYNWADAAKTLPRLSRTRDLVQDRSDAALSPSLTELLAWHRTFEATNPRDKVYGLLGLHHDNGNPLLRPDYSEHTTDQQVFCKAAMYCITQHKRLDILTLSQAGSLPSWVPNWASEGSAPGSPSTPLLQKYNVNSPISLLRDAAPTANSPYCDWRADDLSAPRFFIDRDYSRLGAKGRRIGIVAAVGELCEHPSLETILPSWDKTMLQRFGSVKVLAVGRQCCALWARYSRNRETGWGGEAGEQSPGTVGDDAYVGGGTIAEAYLRTITLGRLFSGKKIGEEESSAFWDFSGEGPGCQATRELFSAIKQHPLHRRLLVTQNGYVGMGPASCRVGDVACILLGCSVPLVLRERTGTFSLIGEAYVQGLMEGKMFSDPEVQGRILEEFLLE